MNDYYLLLPNERLGVAEPPVLEDGKRYRIDRQLARAERIVGYEPAIWTRVGEGPAPDWLWGVPRTPLLSGAFKDILESHRSDQDEIQWLPATVLDTTVTETRWIPHFPGARDILDPELTDWGPSGLPIRWALSRAKMQGVGVTVRPHTCGDLIVDASIMKALRRAKLTGFRSMKARITPDE